MHTNEFFYNVDLAGIELLGCKGHHVYLYKAYVTVSSIVVCSDTNVKVFERTVCLRTVRLSDWSV